MAKMLLYSDFNATDREVMPQCSSMIQWSLIPFAGLEFLSDTGISGVISRKTNSLSIHFRLEGNLSDVVIPKLAEAPTRKDELWKETCFEFFIADTRNPGYLEFNLSPSGRWNVYSFDDYRRGMREEMAVTSLPVRVRRELGRLSLECGIDFAGIDLAGIGLADRALEVGISAVLRHRGGEATYWALAHCGEKPDFHRRDGFAIALNAFAAP